MNTMTSKQRKQRRLSMQGQPDLTTLLQEHNKLREFFAMWQSVARSDELGWWQWSGKSGFEMYFNPANQNQWSNITEIQFLEFEQLQDSPPTGTTGPGSDLMVEKTAAEYQSFRAEIQVEYENGNRQWFALTTRYMTSASADEETAVGVFYEITSQRAVEHSLDIGEQRYQIALEASRSAVWEIEYSPFSLYLSDRFFEMLGYEPGEIKSDYASLEKILHPDRRAQLSELAAKIRTGGVDEIEEEVSLLTKDGTYRCFLAQGRTIEHDAKHNPLRTSGIITDITERKKIEEALRSSEERYRKIVQLQSEMICRYRPNGQITFVNQAYCSFFGKSEEELIGSKFWQFVHRDDREKVRSELNHAAVDQQPFSSLHREVLPDGQTRWVEWTDQPSAIDDGVVKEYLSTGRDVTDRVEAEIALRESEERLRLLAEKASDVIAILNPNELLFQFVSPACWEILKVQPEDLIGCSAYEWIFKEDHAHVRQTIRKQMREDDSLQLEFRMVRADGEIIWVETTGKVVRSPQSGKYSEVITITRDISERKRTEQRSRLRSKLNDQLRSIDQVILSAGAGSDFLQSVVDKLANYLHCPRVGLLNFDPLRNSFRLAALAGSRKDYLDLQEIRLRTGETLEALQTSILVYDQQPELPVEVHHFVDRLAREGASRILLLPVLAQRDLIGLFVIVEEPNRPLGPAHIEFLLQAAISLAYGLRQARLLAELREHIHIQDALREISLELIQELELDSLLHSILHYSLEFSGANGGRIYIQTEGGTKLRCVAAVGYASDIADPDIDIDAGLTGLALRKGHPIFQGQYQDWEGRITLFDDRKIDNVIAVPIIHGRERYGAIVLNLPDEIPYTKQKETFLSLFAAQAAVVFRKANVYEQERRASQQLRELHQYLESAREAERARISREIHDELGQRLTGLKMDAAWIARRMGDEPRSVQAKLIDMQRLIDETIQDVRQVATDLRPGMLDELGLTAAIEWKLQDFSQRQRIKTSSHLDDVPDWIDDAAAIAIYRIFQETLTNIARHANATRVEVELLIEEDELLLSVQDNGVGMTEEHFPGANSLGLLGMQERANSIGANFKISSALQEGTEIILRMPLNQSLSGESQND